MADIQEKIQNQFQIDITQENIFKLYKIDSADISLQELNVKLEETRKRWQNSAENS